MKKKTIVVFDEVWLGHVPTYHKIIVASILELGHRVISLSPDPQDLKNWIHQQNIDSSALSTIHYQLNTHEIEKEYGFFKKLVNYLINRTILFLIKLHLSEKPIEKWRKFEQAKLIWQKVDELVKSIPLSKPNEEILVIIPYIDHRLLVPGISRNYIEKHFGFNWVGLHIRPILPGKDLWRSDTFKATNCKGLLVLDENSVTHLKQQTNNNVWLFPDVTDISIPEEKSELERNILLKAAGRTIITVAGFLTPKKNIMLLLKVAAISHQDKLSYFFVFAGHFIHDSWSENELLLFEKTNSVQPENCYLYLHRLNEMELNSIIRSSDIIFAAYRDFNQSSNMLTKAAYFNKPIIVSKGYLIEQRVKKYTLGLAVNQDNIMEINEVFAKICSEEWLAEYNMGDANKYAHIHSSERVKLIMKEIINCS